MSLSVLAWHSSVCDDSELLDMDTGLKKIRPELSQYSMDQSQSRREGDIKGESENLGILLRALLW